MSAYTPGPWGVDGRQVWAAKTLVCWISTPSGVDAPVDAEADANATLIASAPCLLAALREARIALTFYRQDMERHAAPGRRDYPFGIDAEEAARTAIARAEGKVRP